MGTLRRAEPEGAAEENQRGINNGRARDRTEGNITRMTGPSWDIGLSLGRMFGEEMGEGRAYHHIVSYLSSQTSVDSRRLVIVISIYPLAGV